MLIRLEFNVESRLIVPHGQFGFRKGRNRTDSGLKFCGDIQELLCNHSHVVSTFFEVSGALDNADLPTFVEILHSSNIPGKICNWIFTFSLSHRFY